MSQPAITEQSNLVGVVGQCRASEAKRRAHRSHRRCRNRVGRDRNLVAIAKRAITAATFNNECIRVDG